YFNLNFQKKIERECGCRQGHPTNNTFDLSTLRECAIGEEQEEVGLVGGLLATAASPQLPCTRLFVTRAVCDEETVFDDRKHQEAEVERKKNILSANFLSAPADGPACTKETREQAEKERKKEIPSP